MSSISKIEEDNLKDFIKRTDITFDNLDLLKEALTHRSYLNESKTNGNRHNERLEFLGDAVLELIITEFLFDAYPDRSEGDLTSFRAALVRTESLAESAEELGYGDHVFMSKGEAATGGRKRPYILANTFEAVLGAIYLDSGIESCKKLLERSVMPKISRIVAERLDIDAKSRLQEMAQEKLRFTPVYELKSEEGPDHDKEFTMVVMVDSFEFGKGTGRSKQEAEQNAARYALENWEELCKKYNNSAKINAQTK